MGLVNINIDVSKNPIVLDTLEDHIDCEIQIFTISEEWLSTEVEDDTVLIRGSDSLHYEITEQKFWCEDHKMFIDVENYEWV